MQTLLSAGGESVNREESMQSMLSHAGVLSVQDLTVDQKSLEASEAGIEQPQPKETFFQWFQQTGERRDEEFNSDEIADIIREQIWPNPLPLYYGEVVSTQYSTLLMVAWSSLATGSMSCNWTNIAGTSRKCSDHSATADFYDKDNAAVEQQSVAPSLAGPAVEVQPCPRRSSRPRPSMGLAMRWMQTSRPRMTKKRPLGRRPCMMRRATLWASRCMTMMATL